MKERENKLRPEQHQPDGRYEVRYGNTTYKVKIFFDHEGQMTAEDKLKRLISVGASVIN